MLYNPLTADCQWAIIVPLDFAAEGWWPLRLLPTAQSVQRLFYRTVISVLLAFRRPLRVARSYSFLGDAARWC